MRLLGILKDALEIVVSEIERLGFSISPTSTFACLQLTLPLSSKSSATWGNPHGKVEKGDINRN